MSKFNINHIILLAGLMSVKCAECRCAPEDCMSINISIRCQNCTKEVCCCTSIHQKAGARKLVLVDYACCDSGICNEHSNNIATASGPITRRQAISEFFGHVKGLYAAALGVEILCIAAAEFGENTGLYLLGVNQIGIPLAYAMGYGLASFTTFVTILGRYKYGSGSKIDGCCSVLGQDENRGFLSNLAITFNNFGLGLGKIKDLPKQPNLKGILKSTLTILITAETACIVTAETVDLIFFKQAIYLSIPLALLAGAFVVVAPEAYRKVRNHHKVA